MDHFSQPPLFPHTYLGDQALDGVEGFTTVVDNMDLESIGLQGSLGSVDTVVGGSLVVMRVGQGSDLGIGLCKTSKGLGDIGVLGSSHFLFCFVCVIGMW